MLAFIDDGSAIPRPAMSGADRTRISQALAAALGLSVVTYCAAKFVRDGTIGPVAELVRKALTEFPVDQLRSRIPSRN